MSKTKSKVELPKPLYTVTDVDHKYSIRMPGGQVIGPLISVTKVLNVIDKPALKGWAAREAANYFKAELLRLGGRALVSGELDRIAKEAAGAHLRKAKDAADLGTACHDAFEAIIKGLAPENLPDELIEPVNAFKNYRMQSNIEIVATELAVASIAYQFGGRLDFLGYDHSKDAYVIGDYKTSSGFYGNEYAYQAGGGYAIAVEEMYGIDVLGAEIVRFSKKPPYESEARPVTNMEDAKQGFLDALRLVKANAKPLIGAPTFTSAGKVEEPKKAVKKATTKVGF